jgi:dienelactone hydrolase
MSLRGHLSDVLSGLDYVKDLESVDKNRIGMMGFSRGALLTIVAGTRRADLKALVIMAPAPGRGALDRSLKEAGSITAPVLLLVAKNDNRRIDHVQVSREVKHVLDSAGKQSQLIVYRPYGSDGHQMFFSVGGYWKDVRDFLAKHLKK